MKTTKTVFHIFDASAFDEELGFLNEMSEKGWQLKDMSLLSQKYVWDDSVVYRYAIDYQHDLSMGEFKHYRVEFEDQGWEFVSNRGSWYVFRKPYDPALPESEYLIYTDEPSFRDMKRSVALRVNITGLFMLPFCVSTPSVSSFLDAAALLLVGIDSVFCRRRLKHVRCVPKQYRFHLWRYTYVAAIIILALSLAVTILRDAAYESQTPAPAVGVQSVGFTVRLPDVYGVYAEDFWTDAPPLPYAVTDEDGGLVSYGVLNASGNERINLFLRPGAYTLTVDWGRGPARAWRSAGIGYPAPLISGLPVWADLAWIFGWGAAMIVLEIVSRKKYGHATWL